MSCTGSESFTVAPVGATSTQTYVFTNCGINVTVTRTVNAFTCDESTNFTDNITITSVLGGSTIKTITYTFDVKNDGTGIFAGYTYSVNQKPISETQFIITFEYTLGNSTYHISFDNSAAADPSGASCDNKTAALSIATASTISVLPPIREQGCGPKVSALRKSPTTIFVEIRDIGYTYSLNGKRIISVATNK